MDKQSRIDILEVVHGDAPAVQEKSLRTLRLTMTAHTADDLIELLAAAKEDIEHYLKSGDIDRDYGPEAAETEAHKEHLIKQATRIIGQLERAQREVPTNANS